MLQAALQAEKYEIEGLSDSNTALFKGGSRLLSIAGWAPEKIRTSKEIEFALMDSPLKLSIDIEARTGIKERRVRDPKMSLVDMALEACKKAIHQAGVDPKEIDLIIYCGVSREFIEPATATLIHHRLGLRQATACDVSDACLGFIDGWFIADAMIASGRARLALVVTAEAGSKYSDLALRSILNGEDPNLHFASLTLGDGASAALLTSPIGKSKSGNLLTGLRESHGKYSSLCIIPSNEEPMITYPVRLFEAALRNFEINAKTVVESTGWTINDIDWVVPHQASIGTIIRGGKKIGVPLERVAITVDKFGNMASAAVPFALAHSIEQKNIGPGSKVLIAAFGSGLGIGFFTLQL